MISAADKEIVELNKPYSSNFNGINRHFGSTNLDFEQDKEEITLNQHKHNVNNPIQKNNFH